MWLLFVALVGTLGLAVRQAESQLTLPSVVERVKSINPDLQTFVTEQIVDIRFLGVFRWRLRTTLYAARPANYRIVVHDPPALLGRYGTVFAEIASPDKMLADYRATAIQEVGGDGLLLDLVAARRGVNPPAVTVVIETDRWLIKELLGRYDWGEVRAVYQYGQVGEFLLPVRALVTVSSFALRAEINYRDYQLNVSLPPGTFPGGVEAGP